MARERKRALDPEKIKARIKANPERKRVVEGVLPLSGGFFRLERMRSATVVKAKSKVRGKVRS